MKGATLNSQKTTNQVIMTPSSNNIIEKSSKINFYDFLNRHYIKKDDSMLQAKPMTNTRIGDKTLGITGGSYHIPDEEYDDFMRLYFHEIIKKEEKEYLTEKQLDTNGPILVDIDLRYDYSVSKRIHTKDHIFDFVCLYLEELKKIYQFDENVRIPIFIFEKSGVNRVEDKQITKDGIHMIIGLQADHVVQCLLRDRILNRISEIWTDLPITNTWDDVLDKGISQGHTNWQLYGSRKPGHLPYRLKYVYDNKFDPQDGELMTTMIEPTVFETEENIVKMSVRYKNHPTLFMTSEFIEEYEKQKGNGGTTQRKKTSQSVITNNMLISHDNVFNIRTKDQLDTVENYFLESILPDEYELREAYDYTMALPESYYGVGSFTKWIRVGWALRNISDRLFIVWVVFSARLSTFNYSDIRDDLWERWSKFDMNNPDGLTKRSIMHWAKQDAREGYDKVRKNSIDFYIDQTLEKMTEFNVGSDSKCAKGCGDYDIAFVLYHLFKDDYVCVSVKANIWYRYKNHRWAEIDSGTTLRKAISEELRTAYSKKATNIAHKIRNFLDDKESVQYKNLKKRAEYVLTICDRLSRTNDKKNIMIEAKELFYDGTFLQKLDVNPYLLCFNNGVIDFKQKEFRKGRPEDCLSKCTNIEYDPSWKGKESNKKIIEEIEDFMHKLFPNPDLHRYMWDHLASTLVGICANQTFNMYIGIGRNGKSMLVNLMEKVLGDYKGEVPLTLLTQQRTKIGGLAPELVQLKGIRYAVMQEPSKGDKINEGIMKQVTGGDPIQARAPYMPQTISFIPQFKLVVCSNEFMEIKSQDHGTWRRIRVVDFESLFTETPKSDDPDKPFQFKVDKNIKDKFEFWKEIFAAMLVERTYMTCGLVEDCAKVLASSNSYREKQDYIAEFIQDRVTVSNNGCILKTQLISVFKDWYNTNYGSKVPSHHEITSYMEKTFGKLKGGVWYEVKIKYDSDIIRVSSDDEHEGKTESGDNDDIEDIIQEL